MEPGGDEFDIIASLFAPLAQSPGAFGLMDDAAIIPPRDGCDLVVTTDAITEGIDFFPGDPPDVIARKALRVNLSDLAAKGATPHGYLVSLSLPAAITRDWLADFAQGLWQDQAAYATTLLGGDTGRTGGPLSVSVSAFGHVASGTMIRRAGAKPGDGVYVSGHIGDAGGGLALRRGGGAAIAESSRALLLDRYALPRPRLALGRALRGIASAALDVSDGLIADLGHIARASKVGIEIHAPAIPRSAALKALWGDGIDATVRAATAGDDYEIAFTAPEEQAVMQAARETDETITRIGTVAAGAGVTLRDGQGGVIPVPRPGFRHF